MRWIQQNFPVLRKHKKWAFGSTFIAISCKLFIVFNYIASNNLLNDFVFPGNCSGNTQNISLYLGVTYNMFPGYWFNFRQASIESIRIRKLVFSFYCIFVKKNHSAEYPCSVNNANNCLRTCRTHLVLVIFTILFEWSQIFWPLMWIFLTNSEFLTQLCLQFIVIVYVL